MQTFTIKHKDKKTNARIGVLNTKKTKVETPFFMPVATKANVKYISSEDLKEMKAKAIISNALILYLRPGTKVIKSLGGIGKFMNYSGVNFTDSGGFQMYSKEIYISSNDNGVLFKCPFSGKKEFITPEKDMQIQLDIGSDVAMCLDTMPLYHHSKQDIQEAVRKTSLWAKRCKLYHNEKQKNTKKKQLLFGIIQGGIYSDLRKISANDLISLNFDGYSIGGLGLGETWEQEMKILNLCKKIIPENKPVYLMGIGNPVEILEAISHGVDIFDSRMPTMMARRGTLFTSKGKLRLMNKKHEFDKSPLDKDCNCFVCKNYSRAYLRHQLIQDEGLGKRLVSYHNLFFLQNLLSEAKKHIKLGDFNKFKEKIKKAYEENSNSKKEKTTINQLQKE